MGGSGDRTTSRAPLQNFRSVLEDKADFGDFRTCDKKMQFWRTTSYGGGSVSAPQWSGEVKFDL